MTETQLPGNTSLPSSPEALQALINADKGKNKYTENNDNYNDKYKKHNNKNKDAYENKYKSHNQRQMQ